MTIYVLTGLGADQRCFDEIDFGLNNVVHMHWADVEGVSSIEDYAEILAQQIDDQDHILLGTSFGGIMALEIASQTKPLVVILVAAPRFRSQFTLTARLGLWFGNHVPARFLKEIARLGAICLSIPREKRPLFLTMLRETPVKRLRRFMRFLQKWRPKQPECRVISIMADDDPFFTPSPNETARILRNTGHFCLWDNPEHLSRAIQAQIRKLKTKLFA